MRLYVLLLVSRARLLRSKQQAFALASRRRRPEVWSAPERAASSLQYIHLS